MLFLPNARHPENGDFDLGELVKRVTETPIDGSQRDEILRSTGDSAVLAIEYLDKIVSSDTFKTDSDTLAPSGVSSAIPRLPRGYQYLPHSYWIDPTTITFPSETHIRNLRPGLPRDMERRACDGEGL